VINKVKWEIRVDIRASKPSENEERGIREELTRIWEIGI